MDIDLRTCTTVEAAVMLAPELKQIVNQTIVPVARERDPDRTGGWFSFWSGDPSGEIVLPVIGLPAGLVSPERFQKYIHFAHEKAVRLARNPEHISSFESRDETDPDRMKHKYGGAIRVGSGGTRLIFSFSGFSAHEDEAICAILAVRYHSLTDREILRICEASGNQFLATYRRDRQLDHKPW